MKTITDEEISFIAKNLDTLQICIDQMDLEYKVLVGKYDAAMSRINDLEAENEYLRRAANRD